MTRISLLESLNLSGIGIEIGVQSGVFSEHILKSNPNLHLILLDAWRHFPAEYNDVANVSTEKHIAYMNSAIKKLSPYLDQYTLIRAPSERAVSFFEDNLFDFIYLDANHSESYVSQELENWYPKLKSGGIMAGHDYLDGTIKTTTFGVKSAVDKFAVKNNISIQSTDESFPTWFFKK